MPELPEVETMVRGLRPELVGRVLRRVEVRDSLLLDACTQEEIDRTVRGAAVRAVGRRGKWVVLTLDPGDACIVIQPRMTGGFWLVAPPRPEHVRILFHVKGRRKPIWFCDARRLGKIACYPSDATAEAAFTRSHGPDALEITSAELAARLARTKRPIKPALMDQKLLAGIGNIYADEILFTAGLHPQRVAYRLNPREVARLHRAIVDVLRIAIAAEGSTFDAGYRTVLGLEGGFLTQNSVYGREGQPCRTCGRAIERIHFVGLMGRSTFVCGKCQR